MDEKKDFERLGIEDETRGGRQETSTHETIPSDNTTSHLLKISLFRFVIVVITLCAIAGVVTIRLLYRTGYDSVELNYGPVVESALLVLGAAVLLFWHAFFQARSSLTKIALLIPWGLFAAALVYLFSTVRGEGGLIVIYFVMYVPPLIILHNVVVFALARFYRSARPAAFYSFAVLPVAAALILNWHSAGQNFAAYAAADIPDPMIPIDQCWKLKFVYDAEWIYDKCSRPDEHRAKQQQKINEWFGMQGRSAPDSLQLSGPNTDSSFELYTSELGFSLQRPTGWQAHTLPDNEAYFGGVQFYPLNSVTDEVVGVPVELKNVTSQMLSIDAADPFPPTYDEIQRDPLKSLERSIEDNISEAEIVASKMVKFGRYEAPYVQYRNPALNLTEAVLQLATEEQVEDEPRKFMVVIKYSAREGYYDQSVIDTAITTFQGTVLAKRIADEQAKLTEDDRLAQGFVDSYGDARLPSLQLSFRKGEYLEKEPGLLANFYYCPNDTDVIRVQKATLPFLNTRLGGFSNFIQRYDSENTKPQNVSINGIQAVLTERIDGKVDEITWVTDRFWMHVTFFCDAYDASAALTLLRTLEY